MSLRSHPLALLRPRFTERGVSPTEVLKTSKNEDEFILAGLVLVRQRPGTASGVVFVTIEDEHGIANLVVWPRVFEAHRRIVMGSRLLGVRGHVQREGLVIHLVAEELWDWSAELDSIAEIDEDFRLTHGRGDQVRTDRRDPRRPSAGPRSQRHASPRQEASVGQGLRPQPHPSRPAQDQDRLARFPLRQRHEVRPSSNRLGSTLPIRPRHSRR